MTNYPLVKSAVFEGIGSYLIFAFSSITTQGGKVLLTPEQYNQHLIEHGIRFFLSCMIFMWMSSKELGSQFNPILSLSLLISGDLNISNFFLNIFSQSVGVILAILTVKTIENGSFVVEGFEGSKLHLLLIEIIYSFSLCLVFLSTYLHKQAYRAVYAFVVPGIHLSFILTFGRFHLIIYNFIAFLFISKDKEHKISKFLIIISGEIIGTFLASILYRFVLSFEFQKIGQGSDLELTDSKKKRSRINDN